MEFKRIGLTLGLLLVAMAVGWYYLKDSIESEPTPIKLQLGKGETAKVLIEGKKVIVVDKNNTRTVTDSRRTTVTVKEDGKVIVKVKKSGFVLEPGIGLAMMPGPGATLDLQCGYVKRIGFIGGLGYEFGKPAKLGLKAYLSISYDLPFTFTQNTGIFVGVTHRKDFIAGLRVRF
jgi:hypothetical protein